ncbi:MAG: hypothetical protein U9O94_09035, partial [Nanoarchaeota archaeon]|nr:hypothetical protein [Nanoarchaeota archaeon]
QISKNRSKWHKGIKYSGYVGFAALSGWVIGWGYQLLSSPELDNATKHLYFSYLMNGSIKGFASIIATDFFCLFNAIGDGITTLIDVKKIDKIKTYDEFIEGDEQGWPRYNNFPTRFNDPLITIEGDKKEKPYLKLKKVLPELEAKLRKEISFIDKSQKGVFEKLQPYEPDLYVAYVFMRLAGAKDNNLFN